MIIKSTDDVTKLISCLNKFQKNTSARINWDKCASLLLGEWGDIGPPQLPQQCKWAQDGFKVLGVFWGTAQYIENNWEGLANPSQRE